MKVLVIEPISMGVVDVYCWPEAAVLMEPGCPGALTGTIQSSSQLMSGQPDKRNLAIEQVGASTRNAGRRSPSRASVVTVMPVSAPRGALTGREARDTPGERSRLGVILPRLSRDALAVRGHSLMAATVVHRTPAPCCAHSAGGWQWAS